MTFVEFTLPDSRKKAYFVGASHDTILADTNHGTSFAGERYASHKVIDKDEVPSRKLLHFATAVRVVEHQGAKSFYIGTVTE